MISKFIITTGLLLAASTAQAGASAGWDIINPWEAWLNALEAQRNIHNAEQWIGNFAEAHAKVGREVGRLAQRTGSRGTFTTPSKQWFGSFAKYLVAPGNDTLAAMAELMDTDNFLFSLQPNTVSNTLVPWASFAPVSNFLIGVVGGFSSFNVTYRADPVGNARKVVLFPESAGQSGLKGAYEQQYVVSLSFNDEGKIDLYEEFVDSLYTCGVYGSALTGCPPLSE